MTEFIAGEHAVWRRLRKLFQGNHRAYVAVAFLGSGANRRLRLTRGDTLVVNAGEAAVKRGLTDPSELRKYYRKGVSVYSHDKLHAKVFVSGQTAAVGSANVSQNSESHLSEAIVVTSDRNTVHDAKRFVQNSAYFEIGPEYLKNLEAIYVPPKGSIGGRRKPKGELIWAVQLVTKGWSSTAQSAADKGRPVATRKLSNSRTHKIDEFQWPGENLFGENQQIVQLVRDYRGINRIHPLGSIVHQQPFVEKNRKQTIVYSEIPRRQRARLWAKIKKHFRGFGTALLNLKNQRRLRNPLLIEKLRSLWLKQ